MKNLLIAVALVLTSTAYAFAGSSEIDPQVITTFKEKFPGAKDDTWTEQTEFYKVSFKYEGKALLAYYSKAYELICVIRHIVSTELPSDLQEDIKRNYSAYWITDLFELTSGEQSGYFITLQNADSRFILNSNEQNNWEVFRTYQNQ